MTIERGQFFTKKEELQNDVFNLCINSGRSLEPSAGAGFLCSYFENRNKKIDVSLEIDNSINFIYNDIEIMNFFDYSISEKFDTILGNPPYVKQQLIEDKEKIISDFSSLNLFLYFIEKSFHHLNDDGEIIFIIPREFFTNSRASGLRELLYKNGTITDIIDYQERRMFDDAAPYVITLRYQKGNFSHKTNYTISGETETKNEILQDGFIKFVNGDSLTLDNFFDVKVGIVSGANEIYQNDTLGNVEIICSDFIRTKKKKKYIFFTKDFPNDIIKYLEKHKEHLISRRVKRFNEDNWFEWGAIRNIESMTKEGYCIYVNSKTREDKPFFKEKIGYFDGSILALIPKDKFVDIDFWLSKLNNNKKSFLEQGLLVGNKFQLTQRTLSKFLT